MSNQKSRIYVSLQGVLALGGAGGISGVGDHGLGVGGREAGPNRQVEGEC